MVKKPYYSDTPSVPGKRIAAKAPTAGPRLGTQVPTIVPKKPGRTRALVQPTRLKVSGRKGHRPGHK